MSKDNPPTTERNTQDRPAPDTARPLSGRPALVLGAGVAGLALATALRRFGADVSILEQAPQITEVGAGLQISPNGARVLAALGLNPDSIGDRTEAVELRDHGGRLVTRLAMPQDGPGFYLSHRADLIAALEQAMREAGTRVQLLQKVERIALTDTGARIRTAIGTDHDTPLVLGADGLHSALRTTLDGPREPFFTGQVAWRALIPGDGGARVAQVFMGPGQHLVSYPLRGGTLRNIVAVQERRVWAEEGWNHSDEPSALQSAFRGFGGPVPGWLDAVREVYLWGLFRHPVTRNWHDGKGRAALLGDAAHPTLPFMAQGANMALEDAWVLARSLAAKPDDRTAALRDYAAARHERVSRVVGMANANARNYHLRAPIAPFAHGLLRLADRVAPTLALKRFSWIYDHDVTR
ncbi:FAD-dependent monooxygenase [Rhodobacter sp. NTK016B]|uniref:FAD-dependent monooxygenase n=1 Tax=Rhodobacter sp. NTK016B TaxID=2759676 RepID=UPI001A8FD11F|nr:FAD-dependent monooxygenase [Rhodobacter sp. NTK016B]MBN8294086.1 FAD-dependent monooxygenase [Rhodobacter sp. NTK016B]